MLISQVCKHKRTFIQHEIVKLAMLEINYLTSRACLKKRFIDYMYSKVIDIQRDFGPNNMGSLRSLLPPRKNESGF